MKKSIHILLFSLVFFMVLSLKASELMLFDSLSVKGIGLSGCMSALRNDPDVMTVNPAGLGSLSGISVSANFILGVEGTSALDFTYGMPMLFGTLGASVSYMFINGMPNFDISGVQLADLSAGDMVVSLGWGKRLGKVFSMGLGAKIFSTKLDTRTGTSVAFDAGIQATPFKHLDLGISVQNLGPAPTFISAPSDLPLKIRGGVQLTFIDSEKLKAFGAVEVIDTLTQGLKTSLGMELTYLRAITFRIGYKVVNSGEYGLSTGFSLNISKEKFKMGIDYAFLPSSVLNAIHAFGVRFFL